LLRQFIVGLSTSNVAAAGRMAVKITLGHVTEIVTTATVALSVIVYVIGGTSSGYVSLAVSSFKKRERESGQQRIDQVDEYQLLYFK
jgi:hypothetical protein